MQDGAVRAVGVTGLDDHEVVSFEREAVAGDCHRGDGRGRDQPRVQLVPQHRPRGGARPHLPDRARGGDDTGPEPVGQQPGGEPVIAVAVGDEDVRQVPALALDPVADRTRLFGRQPRVRQHRLLAAVDQRAGLRGEPLRLSVRQQAVLWRRVVDEHVVGEVPGQGHAATVPRQAARRTSGYTGAGARLRTAAPGHCCRRHSATPSHPPRHPPCCCAQPSATPVGHPFTTTRPHRRVTHQPGSSVKPVHYPERARGDSRARHCFAGDRGQPAGARRGRHRRHRLRGRGRGRHHRVDRLRSVGCRGGNHEAVPWIEGSLCRHWTASATETGRGCRGRPRRLFALDRVRSPGRRCFLSGRSVSRRRPLPAPGCR